jgi:uncharacterized protein with HEPN domain
MEKDKAYIKHIYDAILTIETFTDGLTFEEFVDDKLVQDGVVRELEIIGEAAKNLSPGFRDKYRRFPGKISPG